MPRTSLLLAVAFFVSLESPVARASELLAGPARIVDGDTLVIDGTSIRLHGIDAPESGQTCRASGEQWDCGRRATQALTERIGGRSVSCRGKSRDGYGRVVAVCRLDGLDLNGWMVSQGLAVAARRYSDDYVGDENRASTERRGLWRGQFVVPRMWRRGSRLPGTDGFSGSRSAVQLPGTSASTDCRIKGNISSRTGERVYHLPGMRYYARTVIDASAGERWFCSESEARSAGWRRSKI